MSLSRVEKANVALFEVHALAEAGERELAQALVESEEVIDFAAYRQKRLASKLTERYSLGGGPSASGADAQQLSKDIATLEFVLVLPTPALRSYRAGFRRAA